MSTRKPALDALIKTTRLLHVHLQAISQRLTDITHLTTEQRHFNGINYTCVKLSCEVKHLQSYHGIFLFKIRLKFYIYDSRGYYNFLFSSQVPLFCLCLCAPRSPCTIYYASSLLLPYLYL